MKTLDELQRELWAADEAAAAASLERSVDWRNWKLWVATVAVNDACQAILAYHRAQRLL